MMGTKPSEYFVFGGTKMDYEVRLFITNVKNKKSGWFDFPIDSDEINFDLELSNGDEYTIGDYEAPFVISSTDSIDKINQIAEYYIEYSSAKLTQHMQELVNDGFFSDLLEAFERIDDILYVEPMSVSDLAYHVTEELGLFSGIPETVCDYFDFEKYGRDLISSGEYSVLSSGAWISIRY
ncbi:TPA_asm: hypothetical protein GZU98_14530 [Listeria monocytogenes]|nr:hypothetical protein [Listeria monocytogenes]ECC1351402.1 antirestriction protein ArdA [Listeria monocytogenes]ECC1363034.1 antirestriction protein ArdA [Listeria monocytogenes]ECC1458404.1 antirestriction protein ArdA [Listeria monocytogenes]HAC4841918.1 hypothetical protein [Listeria monocytogenes]